MTTATSEKGTNTMELVERKLLGKKSAVSLEGGDRRGIRDKEDGNSSRDATATARSQTSGHRTTQVLASSAQPELTRARTLAQVGGDEELDEFVMVRSEYDACPAIHSRHTQVPHLIV
jgi:hypothetical protein